MSRNPQTLYEQRLAEGTLNPDSYQKRAVQSLQRLHEQVLGREAQARQGWIGKIAVAKKNAKEPVKGVYLYGDVGRGKSMLMDLFYDSLPAYVKKQRVHFHAFMISVHNYLHERREMDDFSAGIDGALPSLAARIAERSKVLCFDEFHVTDVADAMILGRLFTGLFERGIIVVATSNWPPDRLYEGGLQRDRFLSFIELLKKKLEVVQLSGPVDYRTQFLQSEGTYFWPLGEGTRQKADMLFAQLSNQATPQEEFLTVKGRQIPVPAAVNGVARFNFSDLCEKPHGAEDFLAIAQAYRAVFLENVPKMNYDRRNEAKRLMILIDALYENRTKLIVTAEAPADKLYFGHDHAFEFQRTVSRLQEMQSLTYLREESRGPKLACP